MHEEMSSNDVVWAFRADGRIKSIDKGMCITVEVLVLDRKYFVEFHKVNQISFNESVYETIGDSEVEESVLFQKLRVFNLEMTPILEIDYEFCVLLKVSDNLW